MTAVGDLDAVVSVVAWIAVAVSPVAAAVMVLSWVSQHRRPTTDPGPGPDDVPSGSGPDPADELSSPSGSADTRSTDTRSTDRR